MGTEEFWKGDFGNEYTQRNVGRVGINREFFRRALLKAENVNSLIEFGAGSGENLQALHELAPEKELAGVEINATAAAAMFGRMEEWRGCKRKVLVGSFLEYTVPLQYDISMTKGVLIHIAPEDMAIAYDKLYLASMKYILIAEYFSAQPREIEYRGHAGKLWTRDFGGEMMDRHTDLKLVDVGFHYNRTTGQDNITHWLFEK